MDSRFTRYYDWDDCHVYYWNHDLWLRFSVFNAFALRKVISYLNAKKIAYTEDKCTRGGYLGGGEFRKFTSINIRL